MSPGNGVFSVTVGIRRDHTRRRIEVKFCMMADLQELVLRFEFHKNKRFGSCGVSKFVLSH